jgi:hypothetical protein
VSIETIHLYDQPPIGPVEVNGEPAERRVHLRLGNAVATAKG